MAQISRKWLVRTLVLGSAVASMLLAATPTPRAEEAAKAAQGPGLDSARASLSKWVETQGIISRERKDWQQAKSIMTSRIEILKKEILDVEEMIREARSNLADSGKTKSDLYSDRDAIKAVTESLAAQVATLETQVRKLEAWLPESVRERLKPLYQRIPQNPAESKISLAERFQNVLGILNEVNKINSEITVASEIRALSDGKPSEVKTLYVGLGQAYFVSARGEAGIGRPSEQGWSWQTANALAGDINTALEILQNKSSPVFVPLPVTIR